MTPMVKKNPANTGPKVRFDEPASVPLRSNEP